MSGTSLRKTYEPRGLPVSHPYGAPAEGMILDFRREDQMQDIFWIGGLVGLLAATLAYARLCDNA